ncbi:hypothetical protein FIBSPDRAFT_890403 [Athelia psychrophila]|uniref:Uncharacterized protein n=1 Tax=Athelia psychrophila TaxID=1759441 RepID=A0A166L340_9AGAM|nr:hypothetical protein FIBSPDRAFT_890403 [Fibularhizoctonia sp. CBS 109695]
MTSVDSDISSPTRSPIIRRIADTEQDRTQTVTPAWSRESAAGSESSDDLDMPPLEDVTSDDVDKLMSKSEKDWNEMRKEITDELAVAKVQTSSAPLLSVASPETPSITPTPLNSRVTDPRRLYTPARPQIPVFLVRAPCDESDSMCSTPELTSDKADDQAPEDDDCPETPDPLDQLSRSSPITSSLPCIEPSTPAPQLLLVPTCPDSPAANATQHRDPFGRSRFISRNGIACCIEAEADRVREMSPSDHIMCDEPGYAEYKAQMRQTLQRIEEMSDNDVGLTAFLVFKDLQQVQEALERTQSDAIRTTSPPAEHRPPNASVPTSERAPSPIDTERPSSPHPSEPAATQPDQSTAPKPAVSNPPAYEDEDGPIPQYPRNVWIGDRAYFPGGTNNYVREAATVEGYTFVHVKKSSIISDTRGINPDEIEMYTRLGGNLESFYWPGHLQQADEFSLPLPRSTATMYRMRYHEMLFQRKEYKILIHRVSSHIVNELSAAVPTSVYIKPRLTSSPKLSSAYTSIVDQAHWSFHESEARAPHTYSGTIIYMHSDPKDTDSDEDMADAPTTPKTTDTRRAALPSNHEGEAQHSEDRNHHECLVRDDVF